MRAAVRGVIDFTQARLLDVNWWRRCSVLLNAISREDDKELFGRIYDYHRALVANSGLEEESFKRAQKDAKDAFMDVIGVIRPWEGKSADARKEQEAQALREKYIDTFGVDPSDPDFQAANELAIQEWVKRVETERAAAQAIEDDMERVTRLSLERDERVARLRREQEERRFQQGR